MPSAFCAPACQAGSLALPAYSTRIIGPYAPQRIVSARTWPRATLLSPLAAFFRARCRLRRPRRRPPPPCRVSRRLPAGRTDLALLGGGCWGGSIRADAGRPRGRFRSCLDRRPPTPGGSCNRFLADAAEPAFLGQCWSAVQSFEDCLFVDRKGAMFLWPLKFWPEKVKQSAPAELPEGDSFYATAKSVPQQSSIRIASQKPWLASASAAQ